MLWPETDPHNKWPPPRFSVFFLCRLASGGQCTTETDDDDGAKNSIHSECLEVVRKTIRLVGVRWNRPLSLSFLRGPIQFVSNTKLGYHLPEINFFGHRAASFNRFLSDWNDSNFIIKARANICIIERLFLFVSFRVYHKATLCGRPAEMGLRRGD